MQELLGQLKEVVTQSTCYDEIVSGVSLILLNDNHWIDKELDSLDEKHQEGWDNALYEMERWTAKNIEQPLNTGDVSGSFYIGNESESIEVLNYHDNSIVISITEYRNEQTKTLTVDETQNLIDWLINNCR